MGSHICPNETKHSDFSRTQYSARTNRTQPIEPEDRRIHLRDVLLPLPNELDMETFGEMVVNHTHMLTMNPANRPVPPSSASFQTSYADLPTYDEAITSDQGMTVRTRVAPGIQNVLHHIDYSSNPEEARIHFELTPPSRHIRG